MRVALTNKDETLDELATRVYEFDKPSPTALRSAASALADANPFLRKLEEVPPGTLVTVPEVERATPSAGKTQRAEPLVSSLAAEQLRDAVALVGRQLADDIDAELADAHESTRLARSSEVKALGRDDPTLKEQLPRIAKAASARADDAHALRAYRKEAFAQIATDLEELLGVLGGE